MATQFVERVAIEIDGDGDAVLLLHGLGGSSNTWTPIMAALARHRAIRPDLPGSARSYRVEGPLMIGSYASLRCVSGEQGVRIPAQINDETAAAAFLKDLTAEYL
jgi:3-oxoadipate enol-lactonase